MEEPLTVKQLNTRVQGMLRADPGVRDVWVSGEVSNLKRSAAGHYYFTLKDAESEISCALFAGSRRRIDFEPQSSMKVAVFGGVDIYVPRGNYQFIVDTMRRSGIGELYQAYEALKKRLKDEGLFDASRKRPLPAYPRRIGVVTSETGAVIHDIITTSATRFPADILLAPAQVQGEGAADTIVAGVELLNRAGVDVIVVARGGGSLEDLWPFNEERVARAIAASAVPVVSAVGHETDFTIADFVADCRAPTPTGAAAIILRDRAEIRSQIVSLSARAGRALSSALDRMRSRFGVVDARLSPSGAMRDLDMRQMALDEVWSRAGRAASDALSSAGSRFSVTDARLSPASGLRDLEARASAVDMAFARASRSAESVIAAAGSRLGEASAGLASLNPSRVLERGYGMILGPDGRAVTSVSGMRAGEVVGLRLRDGSASARVEDVRRNEDER